MGSALPADRFRSDSADENRQIESQKNPGSTGRRRPIVAKVRQVENQRRIAAAPDDKQIAEWRARMKQIFATASPLFVEASMQQLIEASKASGLASHRGGRLDTITFQEDDDFDLAAGGVGRPFILD